MTVGRPLYLDGITNYTADEFRTLIDALYLTPGVRPTVGGNDLLVAPTGPVSMAVQVATGMCAVPAKSAANGKYLVEVTAPETVTIAAASAQNRIDIIVAQVLDTAFSDASNTAQIVSIAGTPSGSPVAPATPSNAVLLATVAVNTGAATIVAGNITDKRTPILTSGRLVPSAFATGGARDALLTSPVAGEMVQLTTPPILSVRDPGNVAWQQVLTSDSQASLQFIPAANTDTPLSGSATWITLGNVTVPTWASKCIISYSVYGVLVIATGMSVAAQIKVGTAAGTNKRILDHGSTAGRFSIPIVDKVTGLSAGTQAVSILATWTSGASPYRVDVNSLITAQITFQI